MPLSFTAVVLVAFGLLALGWLSDTLGFFAVKRDARLDRWPRGFLWGGSLALAIVAARVPALGGFATASAGDERRFFWVWAAGVFLVLSIWRVRLHRRARPLFSLVWLAGVLLVGHTALRTVWLGFD